jgi:hypothetical protein
MGTLISFLTWYAFTGLITVLSGVAFGAKLEWRLIVGFLCWPYFVYYGLKAFIEFLNAQITR